MTRNNTLKKFHVAATELPQLLSQSCRIQICLEKQPHKIAVRLCAALELTGTIKVLKVEVACAPVPHGWRRQCRSQCSILRYCYVLSATYSLSIFSWHWIAYSADVAVSNYSVTHRSILRNYCV